MSSKAITEKPEPESSAPEFKAPREWAPSVMTAEEPTLARWIGGAGLTALLVGIAAYVFRQAGWSTRIGDTVGKLLMTTGVLGLLYHAARDGDLQIRRAYGFLGFLWLAGGIVAAIITATAQSAGTAAQAVWISGFGFILAVCFLLAFIRHEDDPAWRKATMAALGVVGVVAALLGMVWGTISATFLLSYGLPLALLGLIYVWAFIGLQDGSDLGYRVGMAAGGLGLLVFAVALVRWLLPSLFGAVEKSWGWQAPGLFLASVGILQMIIGLCYFAVALGLCSEYSFIVLTRRELAAFFYSPMAYFVLFFSAMIAALQFGIFVSLTVVERPEPIIISLVWPLSIFSLLLIVPLLTMRLFSEEQRSGTMEMLQTAPVTDGSVVLSKFVATLIVFMMAWVPYGLFMIALRMEGGQPFDYRPIVSFAVALLCSGGGFVAMGLFYSSLTRNQLVAGVLSAVSMLFLLAPALIDAGQGAWASLLSYISFVDLWRTTLLGKLALKDLAYHISATVVWLFLTMKVLESRKWR